MHDPESMLQEFREEVKLTRKLLACVPADKLGWKPHPRSMTLGQLVLHIASVPGGIAEITRADTFDVSKSDFNPPSPRNMEEVHAALDQSVHLVEETLSNATPAVAEAEWRLLFGNKELSRSPRASVWRSLMFNHWIQHRGQLTVYLRLLDVPVPVTYGPTADETPLPKG